MRKAGAARALLGGEGSKVRIIKKINNNAALGLDAGEAIAVEDSPAGILSARRAGLTVLALRPQGGAPLDQSQADRVINQLSDVLTLL